MKRKLVRQGIATMMVSLPARWVHRDMLIKGDEVEVEEYNNDLIVSTSSKGKKTEVCITPETDKETSIGTLITNAYRRGFDIIKVKCSSPTAYNHIKHVVSTRLIGFEITKEDEYCLIENITEPSQDQYHNIFAKIWMNINTLFDCAESYLKGNQFLGFEDAEEKIQQFDNFCLRVIMKSKFLDLPELEWSFHTKLIHAQREIYMLCRYLEKKKNAKDEISLGLLKECRHLFSTLQQAYKEKNISLLEKVHALEKDIVYDKGYNALQKKGDNIAKHHIIAAARTAYLASSPLMGIFISSNKLEKM